MAIRKRQLVLAALVVALGAAVYLNWQFGGNSQIVDAGTSVSDKELGPAQLVNGSVDSSPSSAVSEAVSSAVSGNIASEASSEAANTGANTDVNTYFAQARLERQKSRDASQELVQKCSMIPLQMKIQKQKRPIRQQKFHKILLLRPILKIW